jgi:hypothetical protein
MRTFAVPCASILPHLCVHVSLNGWLGGRTCRTPRGADLVTSFEFKQPLKTRVSCGRQCKCEVELKETRSTVLNLLTIEPNGWILW